MESGQKSDSPHILLIQTDQHNARLLSCAGHADVPTPNIDRIARRGVRFTNAFCPTAICQASRVAMFAGQCCHTTGAYENSGMIRPDQPSLVASLRDAGYETVAIGKLHFAAHWSGHGFETVRRADFSDCVADPEENEYYAHVRQAGMAEYYDLVGDALRWGDLASYPSRLPLELTQERWLAETARAFLRQRDARRPFFCFLSFSRPHNPWAPSAPFHGLIDPASIALPPTDPDEWASKPFRGRDRWHDPSLVFYYPGITEARLRRALALYYGLIAQIDAEIGRVLDELERQGLADNTVVVFTSDHGDFAGEHGIVDKGVPTLDGAWRVPLLMALPAMARRGVSSDDLVNLTDLMPTLLDCAGVPLPRWAEGISVRDGLETGRRSERDAIFYEYRRVKTVRTRDACLSHYFTGAADTPGDAHSSLWAKGGELYDLRADPHQFRNVYDDPVRRDLRLELTERLLDWHCETEPVHRAVAPPAVPAPDSELARFTIGYRFGRTPEQNRERYFRDHPLFAK